VPAGRRKGRQRSIEYRQSHFQDSFRVHDCSLPKLCICQMPRSRSMMDHSATGMPQYARRVRPATGTRGSGASPRPRAACRCTWRIVRPRARVGTGLTTRPIEEFRGRGRWELPPHSAQVCATDTHRLRTGIAKQPINLMPRQEPTVACFIAMGS